MFTNNWFEITGIKNFEKYVLPLTTSGQPLKFLEVGCYEGRASVWLMENTNAKLVVIDTFAGGEDLPDEKDLLTRFRENIAPFKDRVEIWQGTSQDNLKELSKEDFDFIYIDGSHLAKSVLEDAVLAFPLLKKNGIMIFDDYTWRGSTNQYELPAMGIDAFLFVYADQLEILEKNSQVIITKPMKLPL